MTIEEDFFAAVTAGSPTILLYPEVMPEQPILPAATFTVVGGEDRLTIDGDIGSGWRVVQVDTYASTRLSADNLMANIQAKLAAATTFALDGDPTVSGAPRYESDTQRYRASKEFRICFD